MLVPSASWKWFCVDEVSFEYIPSLWHYVQFSSNSCINMLCKFVHGDDTEKWPSNNEVDKDIFKQTKQGK